MTFDPYEVLLLVAGLVALLAPTDPVSVEELSVEELTVESPDEHVQ